MTDNQSPVEATYPGAEDARKPRFKLWHKIVGGVVAGLVGLIALVLILATVATSGASTTSDEFVDHLLGNDAPAAYAMFSSEAKTQVPEDQFAALVEQMSSVLDDTAKQTSKSVEGSTDDGSTGVVAYEIDSTDGTYVLTVNLVKEDGDWRVLNFDNSRK